MRTWTEARGAGHGTAGYALPTVMIFCFILIIAGMSFFAMSSYETRQALYRQNSSEAFYLADGAIERARARFGTDRSWRAGWSAAAEGRGTYDLTVADTTYQSYTSAVKLVATGHVKGAHRRVEVVADVPPTALGLPLLVMGDAEVGGNLCLTGDAHINGSAGGNNGNGDPHFTCDGEYTEGFVITPPPIYTDPAHFPDATYYYVRGTRIGSVDQAKIFDRNGNDITGANTMTDVVSYAASGGVGVYTYSFSSHTLINNYFNDASGVFKRVSPNTSAVVNFGELPLSPAAAQFSKVVIDGSSASNIHATVINTRFTGATEDQRIDWQFWAGRTTEVKQITFEPYNGIAMILYDLERQGSAQAHLGTSSYPALIYVTRDVVTINSNLDIVGSLICLRDFHSTGGPDITFNPGFIPNLPDYLQQDWPSGVSGTLKVLRWREIPA
ncbi:MAG: hypothetical protein FJY88_00710 [Candidatus Eisenbacteria bacterium]|nr:hypothetical protein [Candidatus Eisenbacteria bacterium]